MTSTHLSDCSKTERERQIKYLASLPLRELRRRQDITHKEQKIAYKNYMLARQGKIYSSGGTVAHWEKIGEDLDAKEKDLIEAIDRREFPVKKARGVKK